MPLLCDYLPEPANGQEHRTTDPRAAGEARARSLKVCGVITAPEVVARQGDGPNYPESFKDPLHAGTEFDLLERRSGWYHIRLSDNSDGWIPDNSAGLI